MSYENIVVSRDCEAIQIPHGNTVTIPEGTLAIITQSLGGTYTLQVSSMGGLFRVNDRDADAIGKEPSAPAAGEGATAGALSEEAVWGELRNVYDPEIPVNIVDLGLIYDCHVTALPQAGRFQVGVKMTLTAPGCGMGPVLQQDVSNKLLMIEEVDEADVELVWDPQWNQSMMTEAAKLQLGLL